MSAWETIACLLALRTEFNSVAPSRDKGADGTIGDTSHSSSSDHTPDEDSDVLRSRDSDANNEVHALDIDSTGPWPGDDGRAGNRAGGWFDKKIREIAAREREEFLSPTIYGRLQYIIWRGQIISRSWEWSGWREYSGPSPHYDHVHFSARYLARTESDTRSWGVAEQEEDVALTAQEITAIAEAVWARKLQDPYDVENPDRNLPAGTWLKYSDSRGDARNIIAALGRIEAALAGLASRPGGSAPTTEQVIEAIREVLRDGVGE